jgi:nitroimidazol reductase NimA-like FMN-containing flavoprotein (pyridoxamine 5'-phosphate oxidase superfamily)
MFKEMRRQDRKLSDAETDEILLNGNYGVLSMIGENGYAYGIPLSYVYSDNSIYLHCAMEGQKLTDIRNNNNVSFCVVGEASPLPDQFSMKYKSAIIFGKAIPIDGEEKLKALIEKYSSEYLDKGKELASSSLHKTIVIRIDIERITGKARR